MTKNESELDTLIRITKPKKSSVFLLYGAIAVYVLATAGLIWYGLTYLV